MTAIVPYAVWLVLILVGLSLLTMAIFGLRSMAHGKISWFSMGAVLLPIVLMVILGFATGDWPWSAMIALLVVLGLACLALVLSGLRSIVGL